MISLYTYFFESGLGLLKNSGILSYITPQQYLILDNCKGVRDLLRENHLVSLSDFSNIKVFEAGTYPFVTLLKKEKSTLPALYEEFDSLESFVPIRRLNINNPISEPVCISPYVEIINKIEKTCPKSLKDFADVFCASSTTHEVFTKKSNSEIEFITVSDITPYCLNKIQQYINKSRYSKTSLKKQKGSVIYTSRMTKTIRACFVENNKYLGGKVNVVKSKDKLQEKFILAILNSKLLNFWYCEKYSMQHLQGGYLPINTTELEKIPIPKIAAAEQKPIIDIVDKILAAKAADPASDTSALEAEVERLVYGLYGLTAEEIAVVEGEK